ncbi:MAG: Maf family protein [Xanthobacteraceae bacterium]|jgi:septum formation protein
MALWRAAEPLVLASKSTIRRSVLESAGVPVEIAVADIDERGIESQSGLGDPGEVAKLLAREKARAVSVIKPGRMVLGADQTLALGGRRFSKAPDRAGAREQLKVLRGSTHALHSAVAVLRDGSVLYEHVAVARLTMRAFSDEYLESYLDEVGGAALSSVGGYQLEGRGAQLTERVEGDHFTVLGMPLFPLLEWLRAAGLLAK